MSVVDITSKPYSTQDLGFDMQLTKPALALDIPAGETGPTPNTQNVMSAPSPSAMPTGEQTNILFNGKSSFTDTTAGFRMGVDTDGTFKFYMGDATTSFLWDGATLTITGALTATSGSIGGFSIGADYIRDAANSFGLASTVTGGDDVRFWAGAAFASRATAPFRVTEAGAVTASNITITGGSIGGSATVGIANVNLAARGWIQTSAFTVTDADTIAWGAGTFTSADGTAYSINSGNTGNMAAKTFVYLDIAVSTTAYQTTTTAATAVGAGKVLVAICQNATAEATFMLLNNNSYNIDAANIIAGSITANEIAASTITGSNILTLNISGKTATFDTGTIGGFTMSATTLSATNFSVTSGAANTARVEVGTGANTGGINSANGASDITFWSGASFANRATAPFRVDAAGNVTMTSATISGYVIGTRGSFGGDGSDGALSLSSGTTTIDLGGVAVFVKNYSSISITGTGQVAFSNPNANGTTVIFKCQGACTITSSAAAAISLRGLGGAGGTGMVGNTAGGGLSSNPGSENALDYGVSLLSPSKYGAAVSCNIGNTVNTGGNGGSLFTAGTGSGAGTPVSDTIKFLVQSVQYTGYRVVLTGAGGGGGLGTENSTFFSLGTTGAAGSLATPDGTVGGNVSGSDGSTIYIGGPGGGGAGAGAMYMEVAGAFNFGASATILCNGGNGGAGGNSTGGGGTHDGGPGAGGGSGGTFICLYNTLTANSGTITITGGTGGAGGTGASRTGAAGGNGGNGFSLVARNIILS